MRSEQSSLDESANPEARGIPGALSNAPPLAPDLKKEAPESAGAGTNLKQRSQTSVKNYEVSISSIKDSELDDNPDLVRTMSVKPPRGSGEIRMIRIGDNVDYQPCGGTHVNRTSEISSVRLLLV